MNFPSAVICLLTISLSANGLGKWDSSLIADSMKTDAHAVVRYSLDEYERLSPANYLERVHQVTTVLNENGTDAAILFIPYDRNSKVTDVEGVIYDKNGEVVREMKKKDIEDVALNGSYTLFSDQRAKVYKPANNNYPYTVEYRYTLEYSSTIGFGPWRPQWFHLSVEKAQLSFITPSSLPLRHKELNYPFIFGEETTDKRIKYRWEAANLRAIPRESSGPEYLDLFPVVLLGPNDMVFEGHKGDYSNWNSYGKWAWELIRDRDELPPAAAEEIRQLIQPYESQKEKVKALYQYMQKRTRYVSVQLGIGGFQPFPASEVHEKGYGDCKALSNYMRAILKCAGIESWYTEIGNGPYQKIRFPDFPSQQQTNHIVVCVPLERDTVWLECTSQTKPFGYIGSGNSDRYGLRITPGGGVLTRTPVFSADDNLRSSVIKASLLENGSASFDLRTNFRDYMYEDVDQLIYESKEEQKKALLKSLTANGVEISSFSLSDISSRHAEAVLNVKGILSNCVVRAGSRVFVQPNFFHQNDFFRRIRDDRRQNICEQMAYSYRDTLCLALPERFTVEFLPGDTQSSCAYGNYHLSFRKDNDHQVTIVRTVQINKGTYGKDLFKDINAFLMTIGKKESERIVLLART